MMNYLIGGGAIILYIDIYLIIIPTADPSAVVILCNVRTWELLTVFFST